MDTATIAATREVTVMCLFGGMGGVGLGAMQAQARWDDMKAVGRVLGSIDVDELACRDFEMWTGIKATRRDLFDAEQYRDWHGEEPPADWQEVGSDEIRAAAQGEDPDIVIVTAPCKGFSGLLGKEKSATRQYQALNKLTFRGVFLTMEAWKHNLPAFVLFENVKGLASRGAGFLREIKELLRSYGYVFHDQHYDCGEVGGLAQHRKRFLLVARNPEKVPNFLYQPPKQRIRSIGEELERLPLPIDPDNQPINIDSAGGAMHMLPRLAWKTWVRLALIPPGGDWRDLQKIQPGEYTIVPLPDQPKMFRVVKTAELMAEGAQVGAVAMDGFTDRTHHMKYRVQDMDGPAATVIGQTDIQAGAPIVADYRQPHMENPNTHPHKYFVQDMSEPGATVVSARTGSGMGSVADPRIGHKPMGGGKGAFWVQDMSDPSGTVTGDPSHRKSGGAACVADPRLAHEPRDGSMKVGDMTDPAGPVTGSAAVTASNAIGAVADPRPPKREHFNNILRVTDFEEPAVAVTAGAGPNQAAGLVADPRMSCSPRNGTMKVQDWDETAFAVVANGDLHTGGAAAVADHRCVDATGAAVWDCRIPGDDETGVWYLISPHRDRKGREVVNRPITTWELMILQSFPAWWKGKATVLAVPERKRRDGTEVPVMRADRSWRERIGNAFPPAAVTAILGQMFTSILASEQQQLLLDLHGAGVWVDPPHHEERLPV